MGSESDNYLGTEGVRYFEVVTQLHPHISSSHRSVLLIFYSAIKLGQLRSFLNLKKYIYDQGIEERMLMTRGLINHTRPSRTEQVEEREAR